MADEIVQPKDISKEMLHSLFTDAYMDASLDSDGDLMLEERHRLWVMPDNDGSRIRLMTLFRANPSSSLSDRITFANSINDDLIVIRAYVREDGNFGFDYYIPVEGGTTKRNIVMATKLFDSLIDAVAREDVNDVMA